MKTPVTLIKWLLPVLVLITILVAGLRLKLHSDTNRLGRSIPAQAAVSLSASVSSVSTSVAPDADWRKHLASLSGRDAIVWLKTKLDSGEDLRTGEGFVIGAGGQLKQMPTLRVSWLEELGHRDKLAAAAEAKKMLATPTTPEEWAVALRWLALGQPEDRALLEEKTRALLRQEAWRSHPTEAWLEAFDIAVYLGGTSLLPELAELITEKDNRPASFAAFLALDRLVQKDTTSVLEELHTNPDMLATREEMRGNLFARADVSDEAQRRVLEGYLLAPNRTPAELQAFADVFPSANYYVSANLLTTSKTPNATSQSARDSAALATVQAWRQDARFSGLDRQLARIQSRLEQFASSK